MDLISQAKEIKKKFQVKFYLKKVFRNILGLIWEDQQKLYLSRKV